MSLFWVSELTERLWQLLTAIKFTADNLQLQCNSVPFCTNSVAWFTAKKPSASCYISWCYALHQCDTSRDSIWAVWRL